MRSKLRVPYLALGFLIVLLLGGRVANAQLAHLVKDLNTANARPVGYGYMPTPAAIGTTVFFAGDDGGSGNELWKLDTTTGTAARVKDICPGPCSSSPLWLTAFGNIVLFAANDGAHGYELWRSDGTEAGTFLLRDINPGAADGTGGPWIDVVNGKALFSGLDPILGHGLWSTDGTRAGTQLVAQFSPGFYNEIDPLASSGTRLLFVADDGTHGREPWISDGTAAGTHLVHDVFPGAGDSLSLPRTRRSATALPDGSFVFEAYDGTHGTEVWRTDGTDAGTMLVKDINPGAADSGPEGFVLLGGKAYFTATEGSGLELWATDGTPAGTSLVASLPQEYPYLADMPMVRAGNRIYFVLTGGVATILVTSDGTAAGTTSLTTTDYIILALGSLGNSATLLAVGSGGPLRLWKTDGTQDGTVPAADVGPSACLSYPFPPEMEVNGELYFYLCQSPSGAEGIFSFNLRAGTFWKSDGTQDGTVEAQAPSRASSFVPRYFPTFTDFLSPLGGGLFFSADDGVSGPQDWHTDGSAAGTQPVISPTDPPPFSPPVPLGSSLIFANGEAWRMDPDGAVTDLGVPRASQAQPAGNQAFFAAYDSSFSYLDLWKTDGTPAGTAIVPGTSSGSLNFLGTAGSVLIFTEGSTNNLWRSDGTGPGTFNLSADRPTYIPAAALGNDLYFPSSDAGVWTLWKTDGTVAGTAQVKAFSDAPTSSFFTGVGWLTPAGSRLFFTVTDTSHGEELWVSDGTDAGTHLVKDILPGPGSSIGTPSPVVLNGVVFFTANDGIHGYELWVSDGTDAGTHLVKDIAPGSQSSGISYLLAAGGRLFFAADDGTHGIELWTSDGTGAGTHLVKDILPGAESSLPVNLTAVGRHVVFTATDGVHGSEPWVSDGTDAGTFLLQDVAPGAASSGPLSYAIGSSKAFFVADDGTTGAELWTVPRRALDPTFTDVPSTFWAWSFVEALAASGVTGGCGNGDFCPDALVDRAQMAVFLLAAQHVTPPPATGTLFDDVPLGYWAGPWIEELAREGVVSGCTANPPFYCPERNLTRAEMAVLLTVARHENPPPATGTRFADVPADYWAARFIEQLAADGITGGCDATHYCPDQPVTRGQMAVFLATAFHLPLP